MKKITALSATLLLTLTSAGLMNSQAIAGEEPHLMNIENFAGVVIFETAPNQPLSVQIEQGKKIQASQSQNGIELKVTSNIGKLKNTSCNTRGTGLVVKIDGQKYYPEDLPILHIKGSDKDGLKISKSLITGRIGNIGGATLNLVGCGDLAIGNVAKGIELSNAGSGDLKIGNVGENAKINSAGSGDVLIGNIGQSAKLNLAGSGDVATGSVGEDAEINIAGSSDVLLGKIGNSASINIAGSGDVAIESAKYLKLEIMGSGDILVKGGKGEITASIMGSGDIAYRGTAVNPKIDIMGGGDINLGQIEGNAQITKNGRKILQ